MYPSVSTILSSLADKSYLEQWKAKVGEKEAERIRIESANYGNKTHAKIEANIKIKKKSEKKKLKKDLQIFSDDFIIPIKWGGKALVEYPVIWKKGNVGFGGTIDYVAEFKKPLFLINGETININYGLVDWKNPLKTKRPIMEKKDGTEYYPLTNYFLQTAAYTAAYNQNIGCKEKGINQNLVVCNPRDTVRAIHIFYCNPSKVLFYWEIFQELLECYYSKKNFDWDELYLKIKEQQMYPERIKM